MRLADAGLVFLGSGLGGVCRLALDTWLRLATPWPTLVVNLIGSFLLGIVFARTGPDSTSNLWFLGGVGFCGGLTTMSAFALQNLRALQAEQFGLAAAYIVSTVVGCILCCWIGVRIGG